MERIIKLSDLEAAVAEAYEAVKSLKEGEPDARVADENAGCCGVAVALADGTMIVKGDADAKFVLASLAKVPLAAMALSQYGPAELLKKSGCGCCCKKADKPDVPVSLRGVRAISAVSPQNDPEGKWQVVLDMLAGMIGSLPELDVKAYEAQKKLNAAAGVEDKLAAAGFYLYDDAPIAIDAYSKLQSMAVDLKQLAMMGATLAADGVCPATGVPAYDGSINANIIGMMAAHGPHKINKGWLMLTGLPAKSGWGGGMLAVLPGVLAIAAFGPELNDAHVSVKGSAAVKAIATKLGLNAFASAKVKVEK